MVGHGQIGGVDHVLGYQIIGIFSGFHQILYKTFGFPIVPFRIRLDGYVEPFGDRGVPAVYGVVDQSTGYAFGNKVGYTEVVGQDPEGTAFKILVRQIVGNQLTGFHGIQRFGFCDGFGVCSGCGFVCGGFSAAAGCKRKQHGKKEQHSDQSLVLFHKKSS